MTQKTKHISAQELRRFVPLAELPLEHLNDLAMKTPIHGLTKGRKLFKKGDNVNVSFYLLSGEVVLAGSKGETVIAGGTPQSRFPLDHQNPRQCTATVRADAQFIAIDNDLLDILLTWDQNAGYMVDEVNGTQAQAAEDDSDWMMQMLRSSIFHRIPPANIQAVFMHMEEVPCKAGEVVIKQGQEGDYYYHIKQGRCAVARVSPKTGKMMKLAELGAGQGFGEEALISDSKRNANVVMLTDGVLMRLAKTHFEQLLKAPVLRTLDVEQAKKMVAEGAIWLDVRLESEYRNRAIPNSLNVPLYILRTKAQGLESSRPYVVYCDTGRRSSSAAYLLNERGFDAYVLKGGLMGLKAAAAQQ